MIKTVKTVTLSHIWHQWCDQARGAGCKPCLSLGNKGEVWTGVFFDRILSMTLVLLLKDVHHSLYMTHSRLVKVVVLYRIELWLNWQPPQSNGYTPTVSSETLWYSVFWPSDTLFPKLYGKSRCTNKVVFLLHYLWVWNKGCQSEWWTTCNFYLYGCQMINTIVIKRKICFYLLVPFFILSFTVE